MLTKSVAAVAVALLVIAFNAQPAGAAGGGTALMTGTVSPDPLATFVSNPGAPFPISRMLTGTGAFVEDDVVAFQCVVTYSTNGSTNFLVGSGDGNLACNGALSFSCSVQYNQVGSREHISGQCSRPALGPATIDGDCVVAYLTTVVTMQCEFTFI